MLAIGIRYLQGIAVGSHGDYGSVEWPPHPARVFMAMVAAHYQTGTDANEREALRWLEEQLPPEIHAPEALPCSVVTQYVPVNDKAGPSKSVLHSLPITRHRIDRTFARTSLASDTVMFHWPDAGPLPEIRNALATLCAKVTRVGHSSSLVQMWLADAAPEGLQHWIVDEARATNLLRVPCEGTLKELDQSFNGEAVARFCELKVKVAEADALAEAAEKAAKAAAANSDDKDALKAAKKAAKIAKEAAKGVGADLAAAFPNEPQQQRPRIATYAGYALAGQKTEAAQAKGSVFSPHLVVFTLEREDGPYRHLDLASTLALTDRWREALAKHADELALSPAAQSLISGHAPDRTPLQTPHVTFLPLGFVGHQHADGRLVGIALALPEGTANQLRAEVLRAAARVCAQGLVLGRLGSWDIQPSTMARPLETLRPATWTAHPEGATHWSTVTPIAYDHHPKAKEKAEYLAEVADMIRTGCDRINIPRPREVIVTPVSAHLGTPPSHAFPRLRRKDGSERRHTHAILIFDEPVRGPILVGAGRYRGYGLCRQMEVLP